MSDWNKTLQSEEFWASVRHANKDTPLAHPVTAWAVVDKDGEFTVDALFDSENAAHAEIDAIVLHRVDADRAPHRIARVEIREIAPQKEQG